MKPTDASTVAGMFDRIAPAYDRVNRLLSWGQDRVWRRRAAECLQLPAGGQVLDVAVGTGDLLFQVLESHPQLSSGVGVDLSEQMLALCREKAIRHPLADKISLEKADAMRLPFKANSFDGVTIAFGIRNTTDRLMALQEMVRVLKDGGGQVAILEFSLPRFFLVRWGYLLYIRTIVPLLGGMVSRKWGAYQYLNQTIEGFYRPEAFVALMRTAGFQRVDVIPLCMGGVCLFHGWV